MRIRKSVYDRLSETEIADILSFYSKHTAASTCRRFNLPVNTFGNFLDKHNIERHSTSLSNFFASAEADGYDSLQESDFIEIIEFYREHSMTITSEHFNIKEYFIEYILKLYNVEQHTVKEEIALTTQHRYGVSHAMQNKLISKKAALTKTQISNEDKKAIQDKISTTKLNRYGSSTYNNREKFRETCISKYGVENVFQDVKTKEKSKQTKLIKYNNANYTNRKQAMATCQSRYNNKTYLGSEKALNDEVYKKSANIRINKALQLVLDSLDYSDLYKQCYSDTDYFKSLLKGMDSPTISEVAKKLEASHNNVYGQLLKKNLLEYVNIEPISASHYEDEIVEYIGADLCVRHDRSILSGKEIDIYIPSKKIGIEFNGTYWHSSAIKPRNYHLEKSKQAAKAGIRLIHIYEYEWQNPTLQAKLKLMLNIALGRVGTKIYARDCLIKQISNKEAKVLNDKVHLQGHRSAQVTYGLFYKDELVQLMSFSKTRYNKNLKDDTSWEIIRGCPGSNNIVVGGVSKLLSHFIKDYKPTEIFSYCDFNKFDGKAYEKAGMSFIGYTGPDLKWILADGSVVSRQPSRHKELAEQSVGQIFGSGSKKYILQLSI